MTTRGDEPVQPAQGQQETEQERERQPRSAGEGPVKPPDPEEVPELLGERSDYPMPRVPDAAR